MVLLSTRVRWRVTLARRSSCVTCSTRCRYDCKSFSAPSNASITRCSAFCKRMRSSIRRFASSVRTSLASINRFVVFALFQFESPFIWPRSCFILDRSILCWRRADERRRCSRISPTFLASSVANYFANSASVTHLSSKSQQNLSVFSFSYFMKIKHT